jgi:predicted transcriptional regulator
MVSAANLVTPTPIRNSFWAHHYPITAAANKHVMTSVESEALGHTVHESNARVEVLIQECQKACRKVSEVTAIKRDLSIELEELEKKIANVSVRMKEVSQDLAEAAAKMANESQRLKAALDNETTKSAGIWR